MKNKKLKTAKLINENITLKQGKFYTNDHSDLVLYVGRIRYNTDYYWSFTGSLLHKRLGYTIEYANDYVIFKDKFTLMGAREVEVEELPSYERLKNLVRKD